MNIFSSITSLEYAIIAGAIVLVLALGLLVIMMVRHKKKAVQPAQQPQDDTSQQPKSKSSTPPSDASQLGHQLPQPTFINQIGVVFMKIIVFLPTMFMGFLDLVHTSRFKYYGLISGVVAIESVFAFRASIVYYDVLDGHANPIEQWVIALLVFIAIFFCGFMLSTNPQMIDIEKKQHETIEKAQDAIQQKMLETQKKQEQLITGYIGEIQTQLRDIKLLTQQATANKQPLKVRLRMPRMPKLPRLPKSPNLERILKKEKRWTFVTMLTAGVVILHDWAGVIYVQFAPSASGSQSQGHYDLPTIIVTLGMCALTILPFIMGSWADKLKPAMEEEKEHILQNFTSEAHRKIKLFVIQGVLRYIPTTDLVRLVQALPTSEFGDFKKFVMPIIGPGQPLELPAYVENPLALASVGGPIVQPKLASITQEHATKVAPPNVPQSETIAPAKNQRETPVLEVSNTPVLEEPLPEQTSSITEAIAPSKMQEITPPKASDKTEAISQANNAANDMVKPASEEPKPLSKKQEIILDTLPQTDPNESDKPAEIEDDWNEVIAKFPGVKTWLSSGRATVSIEEIAQATGLDKNKIGRAKIHGTPRNKKIKVIAVKAPNKSKHPAVLAWLKLQEPIRIADSNPFANNTPKTDGIENGLPLSNTQENSVSKTPLIEENLEGINVSQSTGITEEENVCQSAEIDEEITDAIQEEILTENSDQSQGITDDIPEGIAETLDEKSEVSEETHHWADEYRCVPLPEPPNIMQPSEPPSTDELPVIDPTVIISELAHA